MKKLLLTLAITLALLGSVKAADTTHSLATGSNIATNLFDGGGLITVIEIYNGTSIPVTYALFDAPPTNSTFNPLTGFYSTGFSNGGYTTKTSYMSNVVRSVTNFFGVVTSVTNTSDLLFTVDSVVAASTNSYPIVASGTVVSSNTASISLPGYGRWVAQGLTVTNTFTTNSTVRVVYTPAL